MTNARKSRQRRRATSAHPVRDWGPIVAAAALMVVVGAATLMISFGGNEPVTPNAPTLARTGEINDMGAPVVQTPGSASGTASAAGLEVRGANWALGTVPLDVAVRPDWTLTNTSTKTITLGQPEAEVRQGCCPGPFTLGASTLAPGQSTRLTFELAMHPGMDGWHDILVHMPVSAGSRTSTLDLDVTGDFRGEYLG
jgi:hypothetical protein